MNPQVWAVQRRGYEDETWLFMHVKTAIAWYHNYRQHSIRPEVKQIIMEGETWVNYYDNMGNYIAIEIEQLDLNNENTSI